MELLKYALMNNQRHVKTSRDYRKLYEHKSYYKSGD